MMWIQKNTQTKDLSFVHTYAHTVVIDYTGCKPII